MTYSILCLASRKPGITHDYFEERYERHMRMIADMCPKGTAPLQHTRWYLEHEGPDDKPVIMAGNTGERSYDVAVLMDFEDEAAFGRFYNTLLTEENNTKIEADEAGFWDRSNMKIVVVGDTKVWEP